jgi:murein DD-endopeptidase MepM/ murein hydrolase activator NlpD
LEKRATILDGGEYTMKKSFFNKINSESRSKIIQFLDKKGFYIVLVMCIVIIGVTAVFVTKTNLEFLSTNEMIDDGPAVDENSETEISKQSDVPVVADVDLKNTPKKDIESQNMNNNGSTSKSDKAGPKPVIEKPLVVKQPTKAKDNVQPSKQVNKSKVINRLMPPVEGEIILEYAEDKLVYSKTLEEWRTHKGIDIRSDRGTQVKAAEDGTVEKIYKEDGLGITIIINHGNGLKTKYSNLSSDNMVKINQKVKKGEVISGIGDTATFEIGDQPHLHFEVIKDGKNVDPKTYLPN